MLPEDLPPPQPVEIWIDNWPAFELFHRRFCTQWIQGPAGPTGLNYLVVFHELDRMGLDADAYEEMMEALRTIECAALGEIHRKD